MQKEITINADTTEEMVQIVLKLADENTRARVNRSMGKWQIVIGNEDGEFS